MLRVFAAAFAGALLVVTAPGFGRGQTVDDGGLWLTARVGGDERFGVLVKLNEHGEEIPILFGGVDDAARFSDGIVTHPAVTEAEMMRLIPASAVLGPPASDHAL